MALAIFLVEKPSYCCVAVPVLCCCDAPFPAKPMISQRSRALNNAPFHRSLCCVTQCCSFFVFGLVLLCFLVCPSLFIVLCCLTSRPEDHSTYVSTPGFRHMHPNGPCLIFVIINFEWYSSLFFGYRPFYIYIYIQSIFHGCL